MSEARPGRCNRSAVSAERGAGGAEQAQPQAGFRQCRALGGSRGSVDHRCSGGGETSLEGFQQGGDMI